MAFLCPEDGTRLSCLETREHHEVAGAIKRRYRCPKCNYRMNSIEQPETGALAPRGAAAKYQELVNEQWRASKEKYVDLHNRKLLASGAPFAISIHGLPCRINPSWKGNCDESSPS